MGIVLLETVRLRDGVAPLWPLHLSRLARSAAELGVPLPASMPRPSGGGDHALRFAIEGGAVRVAGRRLPDVGPIRLARSPVIHQRYPHKIDARAWLDDARARAIAAGADDALLADHQGQVVEATLWAIGWWEEDGLVFPPLALGGLRSVARQRLGELSPVRTRALPPTELAGCAVLACNAVRGVVPVSHLDGVALPADPRTAALQERFWERAGA